MPMASDEAWFPIDLAGDLWERDDHIYVVSDSYHR